MISSVAAILLVGITAVCAQQFPRPQYPFQPQINKGQAIKVTKIIEPFQQQRFAYPSPSPYPVPVPAYPSPVPYVSPAPVYASPAPVYASPAPAYAKSGVYDKDASVVAEYRNVDFDGTFSYGFDTDNGISVKSKGYLKNPQAQNEDAIQVIEGSYSFYDREGKPVSISYIADEAGYRAFGDAIPTPPEAYSRAVAAAQKK